MTREHEYLWKMIQERPGWHFPVPRSDLLMSMRTIGFNVRDRGLRLLKRELFEDHRPVGSNLHGYFKMVNPEDFYVSRKHLQDKVNDLHYTIKLHWIIQEELSGDVLELPMNWGGNDGRQAKAENRS